MEQPQNNKDKKTAKENGQENGAELSKNNAGKDHLKEILSYIEKTDLESVQFEKNGQKFSFRRGESSISTHAPLPSAASKEKDDELPALFQIRSPIVGRFYSSMGADRPALIVEGGRVTAGQKVAIVEAMKIKKEVFSAVTGKVVRKNVRDGDAVEYGQELFTVDPDKTTAE